MHKSIDQIGVITVVLESFGKRTLPRILDIKKLVDDGGTLSSTDIEYLDDAINQAREFGELITDDTALRSFFSRVAHLYNEIVTKALENEQTTMDGILVTAQRKASLFGHKRS